MSPRLAHGTPAFHGWHLHETMHAVFVEYFLFGLYVGGAVATALLITMFNRLLDIAWCPNDTAMTIVWPLLLPLAIARADRYR